MANQMQQMQEMFKVKLKKIKQKNQTLVASMLEKYL